MHYEIEYTGVDGGTNLLPGTFESPTEVIAAIWDLIEGSDWQGMGLEHVWVWPTIHSELGGSPRIIRCQPRYAESFIHCFAPQEEDHAG